MLKVFARAFEGFGVVPCTSGIAQRGHQRCARPVLVRFPQAYFSLRFEDRKIFLSSENSQDLSLSLTTPFSEDRQTELETQWPMKMKMMIIHRDPTTVEHPSRASSERGHESSEAFGGPTEIRFNRGHSSVLLCIQSGWAPLGLSDTAIRSYSYNYISD